MRSPPPVPAELPEKRTRAVRSGTALLTLSVPLELVTPMIGGATVAREIDTVDVIRVPSVRGALRFWWRALHGYRYKSPQALAAAERALWGGPGLGPDAPDGRSAVEITVTVTREGEIDRSDVLPYSSRGRPETPGAYALWAARATAGGSDKAPQKPAHRRLPGTRFDLTLRVAEDRRAEVVNSLRAWILFGGYGARTRRGVGSLTVADPTAREQWLPARPTREAFTSLFGFDLFDPDATVPVPSDLPLLAGAALLVGNPERNAQTAWLTALHWLRDFRQGQPNGGALGTHDPGYPRDRGDSRRPGRSNWPEADKVRRLSGNRRWAHPPRHNRTPAWPRAGLGLPIIGQFQKRDRRNTPYPEPEPRPFRLHWRRPEDRKDQERLASPLIVKALPLADGTFVPAALWLNRAYPDGHVVLSSDDPRSDGSAAPFDLLVAPGDTALFSCLNVPPGVPRGQRLRTAFLSWLKGKESRIVEVAP